MTNRWRKKPVVIDAFRFMHDPMPDWFMEQVSLGQVTLQTLGVLPHWQTCRIRTMEGIMTGQPGDWIIRGVKGELYPCKSDIFEATYEPA